MRRLNGLDGLALILAIIGAINWGLIGFFNYNLVDAIFGTGSGIARVIYALVGLSGLYLAFASPMFGRISRRVEDELRPRRTAP
jgi:uncharacterized protein